MDAFNVDENVATIYFIAWKTGNCNLFKEEIENTINNIKEEDVDNIYSVLKERLEEEGLTNKKLKNFNGYATIIHSKSLENYIKDYVKIYGLDKIVEVIVIAFKEKMKNGIKTPTLLNFFKDQYGSGINYYLNDEHEILH